MTTPGPGLLITLDGPGGVGKTTTSAHLARLLIDSGHRIRTTTQPSAALLGQIARKHSDTYRGESLACLVAADRYHQRDTEIRPALAAGTTVICDRYIASSYVLQRMDGVDIEFIQTLNAPTDRPDLAVILTAEPAVTAARIDHRGTRHRFETGLTSSTQEDVLYADTAYRLAALNYPLMILDTTNTTPEQVAAHIAARIAELVDTSTTTNMTTA